MVTRHAGLVRPGAPPMSEIVADPPNPSCYLLFSRPGIEESQSVDPDPFLPRARDARGRLASREAPVTHAVVGSGIGKPSSRATPSQASMACSIWASASAGVSPNAEHDCRSGTSPTQAPSGSDQNRLM